MADPILIDCGGSLRIRQIGPNTNLDGLLDLTRMAPANNAAAQAFTKMHVGHHFQDGTHHLHPRGGPNPGFTNLTDGDQVVVTSGSGHIVQVSLSVSATVLTIDLNSGNPTTVEARTEPSPDVPPIAQRIYRITNSDVIQSVTLNGATVFPDPTTPANVLPSRFTLVAIY